MDNKFAALYVRVSTGKQDAENQLLQLRPYCERSGYTIYKEYMDIISGGEENRPAFSQLFKDAHQKKFDILVFWSIDRFSRSGLSYTMQKLQELKNLRIDWESYQEPYFRTVGPFGDALIGIMATLAKIEKDRISERTKAGLARRKAAGNILGRPKGSKDKVKRRTLGYYDNVSAAKDERIKGGGFISEKITFNGVRDAQNLANKRPFIECPSCSFNLRPFTYDGVPKYVCDKCQFLSTKDEYDNKFSKNIKRDV